MAATLIHIKSGCCCRGRSPPQDEPATRGPARRAGAAPARAPAVQGGRRAAARSRDAAQRAVDASRRARRGACRRGPRARARSRPLQPACRPSGSCLSAPASGRRCRCRRSRSRSRRGSSSCWSGCRRPKRAASTISSTTSATRGDMIVTFLALLEMIRLKLIRVFQPGQLGRDSHLQARAAAGCAASDSRSGG